MMDSIFENEVSLTRNPCARDHQAHIVPLPRARPASARPAAHVWQTGPVSVSAGHVISFPAIERLRALAVAGRQRSEKRKHFGLCVSTMFDDTARAEPASAPARRSGIRQDIRFGKRGTAKPHSEPEAGADERDGGATIILAAFSAMSGCLMSLVLSGRFSEAVLFSVVFCAALVLGWMARGILA